MLKSGTVLLATLLRMSCVTLSEKIIRKKLDKDNFKCQTIALEIGLIHILQTIGIVPPGNVYQSKP